MSDEPYTKKQGQYLAYIHTYTLLHRQRPAHADMLEFFRVTPASVVSMLDRLESKGLIAREPGVARSVRVLLAPEQLPRLVSPGEELPSAPTPSILQRGTESESFEQDFGPIYQLRIDLDRAHPPIWRRILVPAQISFGDLCTVVLNAMGWYGGHLHMFTVDGWSIGRPDPDMDWAADELQDEDAEIVSEHLTHPGDHAKFEYDFGDSWTHTIKLEKILDPDPNQHYPVCIKGRRACPPEDVGGIWGYADFLEVLANPSDPDHDEMLEWVGGSFDPEAFNLEHVNVRLGAIRFRPVDVDSDDDVGGPHFLTLLRWEMISPDLPWQSTVTGMLSDSAANPEAGVPRIETAESPEALVKAFWDSTGWVIDLWHARVADYGTSCIPFLVDAFKVADQMLPIGNVNWHRNQLIQALARLGKPAIPALVEIYAGAPPDLRPLICVALGRLGAREQADLVRKTLEDNPPAAGTGAFVGPLWALIDLGDPRAADTLLELLDEGYQFRELWAMLAGGGDARALFPLIVSGTITPAQHHPDLWLAVAAIVHRVGRAASIEALKFVEAAQDPSGTRLKVSDIVDDILTTAKQTIDAHFHLYYECLTQTDMVGLVRHIIQSDWDDDDLDWYDDDDDDDLDLFDDDLDFDDDDALDGAVEIPASDPFGGVQLRHARMPNGRPPVLPGRNEPCWCGSGKKYKHCHWREDYLGDTG